MFKRVTYLVVVILILPCITACMVVDGPCPDGWYKCDYIIPIPLDQSIESDELIVAYNEYNDRGHEDHDLEPSSIHVCCPCSLVTCFPEAPFAPCCD